MTDAFSRTPSKESANVGSSHFPVLMLCMVSSFGLLAFSRIAIDRLGGGLPNWLSVIGGMAPLVYYHLGYLAPRVKGGLSQAAIDSVYYYGFLVTIFALGTSALSMVSSGGVVLANPGNVIAQFGVGLLATGYAIVARLHLSSKASELGDVSPDALIDHYVSRSRQLVERLDLALHSFAELAQKCELAVQSIDRITRESVQHNGVALKTLADGFNREINSVFAQTKEGLLEVKRITAETAFADERKAFVRNVKSVTDATGRLHQEMQTLASVSHDAATATKSLSTENTVLAESFARIETKLDSVAKGAETFAVAMLQTEQRFTAGAEELKRQINESARAMSGDLQRATEASSLLVSKIIEIAEIVIERTKTSASGGGP